MMPTSTDWLYLILRTLQVNVSFSFVLRNREPLIAEMTLRTASVKIRFPTALYWSTVGFLSDEVYSRRIPFKEWAAQDLLSTSHGYTHEALRKDEP